MACSAKSLSRLKDKHKDTVMQLIAFYSWVAEIPEDDKSNPASLHGETFPNEGTPHFLLFTVTCTYSVFLTTSTTLCKLWKV